jgi:hypothetical protein
MKNKKIALCISGAPRNHHCVDFVKRIAQDYETCVFINYWGCEDVIKEHMWITKTCEIGFEPEIYRVNNVHLEYSSQLFSDMIPTFEDVRKQILPERLCRKDLGTISMCYSIKRSNDLREAYETKHGFKFDCVFRLRFESSFRPGRRLLFRSGPHEDYREIVHQGPEEDPMNYKFNIEDYNLNYIWIPDCNVDAKYGMCDMFGFSTSENMSHYMTVYDRIVELSNKECHWGEGIFWHNISHIGKAWQPKMW